ncbi:unnamed protein product [Amaranthus hypochondriacus]
MVAHQNNTNNMLIKGKRTKRSRPLSPSPLTTVSSTSTDGAATTPSFSAEAEEEHMAHCLILLAQGNTSNNNIINNNSNTKDGVIMSSYECKTCNKSFSSFQALGGHRASHKKTKPNLPLSLFSVVNNNNNNNKNNDHRIDQLFDQQQQQFNDHDGCTTTLSLKIPTPLLNLSNGNSNNKVKVHECGICGAEYSSGQALGGHMRRHRPIGLANTTTNDVVSTIDKTTTSTRNFLSLDLNLPAPEDQEQQQQHRVFSSNEKTLVFSSQLVDCHY